MRTAPQRVIIKIAICQQKNVWHECDKKCGGGQGASTESEHRITLLSGRIQCKSISRQHKECSFWVLRRHASTVLPYIIKARNRKTMHQTENELRRAQPTGSQKSKKSSRTGDIGIARATEEFRIESVFVVHTELNYIFYDAKEDWHFVDTMIKCMYAEMIGISGNK